MPEPGWSTDEFWRVFQQFRLEKRLGPNEKFDDILGGLIILADARQSYYRKPPDNGAVLWSLAISCLLPFWPKSDRESQTTLMLRPAILTNVKRGRADQLLIDARSGAPLGEILPGFFVKGTSLLDLGAPEAFLKRLSTFRKVFWRMTYRELMKENPELVVRELLRYRQTAGDFF